jgi:hypothetical protein
MTTWREFVSVEMKRRPSGTAPKNYMSVIATKWHKMKESGSGVKKPKIQEESDDEEDFGKTFVKTTVKKQRHFRHVPALLPPYDRD